jgi:putative nucleotidyltransferase with HDIG domain
VYLAQKAIVQRGGLVLLLGIIFSLVLGIFVSKRITDPIGQLVEGTRHISAGDLNYQVKVKGHDEISELAGAFNNMADSLLKANKKIHDYFYRAMQSLVRLLEAKDHYTKGHSDRVAEFTEKIARQIGLPPAKIDLLKQAAQLHDIGKLSIDERILNKCSALSEEEIKIIHEHSRTGEDILRPAAFDKELLDLVRSHHEHYDGSGYPDKLKGEEVDLIYQIIPIADAYDAMISSRAYRPPMSRQEAIAILKQNSGTQFNPKVVEAFLKALS